MKKFKFLPLVLLMGCSYNLSIANAQGTNSDMIDDTATPSTSISTRLSAPVDIPAL